MELDDNFQFSYHRLLFFLSRPDEQGYIFCRADDYRFIPKINELLTHDLELKGIHAAVVYLRKDTDEPLLYQVETAATNANALIIANLYDIVNKTENGLANLAQLNFAREALWQINKPILFWADAESMHTIANQAPDLYSQRRHTTVHFTGMADTTITARLQKDGWETFLSSKEFKDIETNIKILEKRLQGAKSSNYPTLRTVTEIVLPLAKDYARLGLAVEAKELLKDYDDTVSSTKDGGILQQLADIYYSLHEYDNAIQALRKANDIIAKRCKDKSQYPRAWFDNLVALSKLSIEIGKAEGTVPDLTKALKILDKGAKNLWTEAETIILQGILGDIMLQLGKLQEAKKYYEQTLIANELLANNNPYLEQQQRNLSVSYNKLGDILAQLGNLQEAKKYYKQGIKIREQLVINNPNSEEAKRDVSISYNRLGEISIELGNLQEAKKYYAQSLEIAEQLVVQNPYSELLQSDMSIPFEKLGDISAALGNLLEARNYYEQALKIRERLANQNPQSEQLQRDINVSYNKLGEISVRFNNLEQAKEYYEHGLKITEQLATNNPHSEQLKRDANIFYSKLGDISARSGNLLKGKKYYEQSLIIAEQLAANNPHSERLQRDVSISYSNLGNISVKSNNLQEAKKHYEQCLKISKHLAANNPHSEQLQRDVAVLLFRIGNIALQENEINTSLHHFEQALSIFEKLSAANPLSQVLKNDIAATRTGIDNLMA